MRRTRKDAEYSLYVITEEDTRQFVLSFLEVDDDRATIVANDIIVNTMQLITDDRDFVLVRNDDMAKLAVYKDHCNDIQFIEPTNNP